VGKGEEERKRDERRRRGEERTDINTKEAERNLSGITRSLRNSHSWGNTWRGA
jgi:hypothetical protein